MDVEQVCRDHGASEVAIARTLLEAQAFVEGQQFDAAIVDLMLNGQSTVEFSHGLRQKGLPFIFASGYSDVEQLRRDFPGVSIVSKPYGGNDLIEALAAARQP